MKMDKINIKDTLKKMGKINKKTLKNGSFSMLYTVILIAVVVVINLIVGEIPEEYTQIDLSQQKLYTISDDTKDFLSTLDQDVTIYYVVQNGNEDDVVEKMLTRYEEGSSHITVEKKDPVLYPNFTSQYTSEEVSDNSLIVVNGESSKLIGYDTLYEADYDYYTGSSTTTGFDGEGQIDSAISYVTSENLPILYTLEGHNEIELNSDLTGSLEKANYQVMSLNLLTEDAVPEDTGCLIIASPQTDISSDEAEKIISYLEAGGKAMIFTDYNTEEMTNLNSVLENYGVVPKDGIVFENDAKHYVTQMPYYLVPNLDSSEITSDLIADSRYILMPAAQAISTLDSYRDTLTIESLLSTSEDAYIKTDVQNMTTYEKEDTDENGQFQLGVMITETVDDENETQIAYYGSSSLLDSATDQQVSGGNTELIIDSLGWMCENDVPVIDVASKSLVMDYLTIPEYDAGYWSAITCGVIPVLFLIIGGIIWFKRRKQ
ncbi:MAG: ABC transporter [Clostridia bacterium]|nr:ABC transporter [Clostridia bacterium]